jgi:hypothetical protein
MLSPLRVTHVVPDHTFAERMLALEVFWSVYWYPLNPMPDHASGDAVHCRLRGKDEQRSALVLGARIVGASGGSIS